MLNNNENIKNKLEEIKKQLIEIQERQYECDEKVKEIDSYFRLKDVVSMTERDFKMYFYFGTLLLISYLAILSKVGFVNNLSYLNFLIIGLDVVTYSISFKLKKWYYKELEFLNTKYSHFLKLADSRLEYEKKVLFQRKKDYTFQIDNIISVQDDYLNKLNIIDDSQESYICLDNENNYSNTNFDSYLDDSSNCCVDSKKLVKTSKKPS